jgi:hypothetical protein
MADAVAAVEVVSIDDFEIDLEVIGKAAPAHLVVIVVGYESAPADGMTGSVVAVAENADSVVGDAVHGAVAAVVDTVVVVAAVFAVVATI